MDGVSPDGAPLLVRVISGIVAVVGAPVDVVISSADRVVLVIWLVVTVPEMTESVLSGEEVESEGTGSEIDTSESILWPGIVKLLVLV